MERHRKTAIIQTEYVKRKPQICILFLTARDCRKIKGGKRHDSDSRAL